MPLTVADYAAAKNLDPNKLASWGVEDDTYGGGPAVRFTYWNASVANPQKEEGRWRTSLNGSNNFKWANGATSKKFYGWDRIDRRDPFVAIVEGESDCHTLWQAGYRNVLGLPGVLNVPDSVATQLDWAEVVCVIDEQDDGSPHLISSLARRLGDKLRIVTVRPEAKDFSELWLSMNGDVARFRVAVNGIIESWREPTADEKRAPKAKVPTRYRNGPSDAVPDIEKHDTANAEILVRLHGDRLHYLPVWNEWLAFNGTRWERDHRNVLVSELAKDVGKALIARAADISDAAARGKALAWANQALGAGRIRSMIELARGIEGIPLDHEQLDDDPWLLGVLNGVVELRTGTFRDADSADLMTLQCPVEWDPEARCPRWEQALEEWFPDPDTRAYVRRLVGQALVGLQRDHLFVIHHGVGANGKGTFVRALQHVLGPYAATPDLGLLTQTKWGPHDTATATLFRARLAVASETEKRVKLAEASIKNLTGGDRISARRLYENPWAFTPTHSLWLMTNYQPEIGGRDAGIWRRIRVVPWVASFTKNRDPELDEKLQAEAPGILRWAVEAVAQWQKHGLDEPPEVIRATTDYRAAEDVLGRFAADVGLDFGPELSIGKTELSELLEEWARAEGIQDVPKSDLGPWLRDDHGCIEDREDTRTDDGKRRRRRIWTGVGIGNEPPGPTKTPGQNTFLAKSGPDGPALPESPIETGLYREFTEAPVHAVQPDAATVCEACDKPGDELIELAGTWVHDTARCRWRNAGLEAEEVVR